MLLLSFLACSVTVDTSDGFPTDSGGDPDTSDTSDTSGDDALTLANCPMSLGDDVPAFFNDYFRCSDIAVDATTVQLHTYGLPPHPTAYYTSTDPNYEPWDDRGGEYQQNPNTIATQDTLVWVPLDPVAKGIVITDDMVDGTAGTSTEEYPGGGVGITPDGVLAFSGLAGPGDDIAEEQYTFDTWNGHPEQTGVYHHHSPNPGAMAVAAYNGMVAVELYAVMCDGTVVVGCTELDGTTPTTADLDAQGGHVHDIDDTSGVVHFVSRYHTHVCTGVFAEYFPEIQYYSECEVL